jgi:hypothetical protein
LRLASEFVRHQDAFLSRENRVFSLSYYIVLEIVEAMKDVRRFSWSVTLVIVTLLAWTTGTLAGHPTDELWSGINIHGSSVGPLTDPRTGDVRTVYIPGETYWGRNQYIEYIAGNLPIIISAPHGGYLKPEEIPDRTWGRTGHDTYSQEYARRVTDYLFEMTGRYPHVIINKLARIKLDANRDRYEAAQGNEWAEQAWDEYHGFIDDAKATVVAQYGRGHYFDFHTNDHADQWVEFGYGLTSYDLNRSDAALDSTTYKNRCYLKSLAYTPGISFPEIIRGTTSLGGLLQARGYKSVPSPSYPHPAGGGYWSGGYNAWRHGSKNGGTIDGTQVETYWAFARDSERDAYSRALAETILGFMAIHYEFEPVQVYLPAIVKGE